MKFTVSAQFIVSNVNHYLHVSQCACVCVSEGCVFEGCVHISTSIQGL